MADKSLPVKNVRFTYAPNMGWYTIEWDRQQKAQKYQLKFIIYKTVVQERIAGAGKQLKYTVSEYELQKWAKARKVPYKDVKVLIRALTIKGGYISPAECIIIKR